MAANTSVYQNHFTDLINGIWALKVIVEGFQDFKIVVVTGRKAGNLVCFIQILLTVS